MRKTGKTITAILSIILVLSSFNITILAQDGWDGVTEMQPYGEGTKADPYLISSAEELAWYRTQINFYDNTSCAKLTADIDLNNKDWIPIGLSQSANGQYVFAGSFDGNGYTIKGLLINISNVDSSDYTFGFFGKIAGISDTNKATVSDLKLEGSIAYNRAVQSPTIVYVGGLVGDADNADIARCVVNVTVTVIKESSDTYFSNGIYSFVSGICGRATEVSFTDCMNLGNVTGTGYAGGIVGEFTGSGSILRCCNLGNITAYALVGGIVGNVRSPKNTSSNFYYCYNSGEITATLNTAGGLIGYLSLDTKRSVSVIGCFSTGNIIAPERAGGCFGHLIYTGGTFVLENTNYLETSAEQGCGVRISFEPIPVPSNSSDEMKSSEFKDSLNETARLNGFNDDVFKVGLNHPIFVWQPDEISAVTLGDINGDGTVSASDVSDLIFALTKGNLLDNAVADINNDGTVSASDVSDLIVMIVNQP